ncbi:MAG: DUF2726 domain-containing protein [Anaerolineae bacterium]
MYFWLAVAALVGMALLVAAWPDLVSFVRSRARRRNLSSIAHYRLRGDLLSPAERSFLLILSQAVGEWAIILSHVGLRDLLAPVHRNALWRLRSARRLRRAQVDFLLCDVQSLRPLVGVVLEDVAETTAGLKRRDGLLASVGLPLVRIPVQYTYDRRELNLTLMRHAGLLGGDRPAERHQSPAGPTTPIIPTCPKCGASMVLRTVTSGPNLGQQYWGCSTFPRCDGTRDYHEPNAEASHTAEQGLSYHVDTTTRRR